MNPVNNNLLRLAFLALCCLSVLAVPSFWPQPKNASYGAQTISVNPCKINYKVSVTPIYLRQIVDIYLTEAFKCSSFVQPLNFRHEEADIPVTLTVLIKNTSLIPPYAGLEGYTLEASENGTWSLRADYYPGFLRGFETFSQLFTPSVVNGVTTYTVEGLPLTVTDSPQFEWRGIMIDTARHFLPMSEIKRTIDSLMYSKMNVMHWHLTDEDSFPIVLDAHPELAQYGSFNNQSYTKTDLKEIVQYALYRGVRVVPEIDTPAHTLSWGRSPQFSDITLNCNDEYEGQFDPTLEKTFNLMEQVLRELHEVFIDPVFHLGGDEIVKSCWDQRPSIKQFMAANNISDYEGLAVYYRKRQEVFWKNFSTKSVSFWANEKINLPTDLGDYLHWWGTSENIAQIANRTNKIILTNYDQVYLDVGYGGRAGAGYGASIITWKKAYTFQPVLKGIKGVVLGGEACLWSEVSNINTHFRKIWPRAAVVGERLWNPNVNTTSFRPIVKRLVDHAQRLRVRGIPSSAVSTQLCEMNPSLCFD